MCKVSMDEIIYTKVPNRTIYQVRVGCIDIACIWSPDIRSNRTTWHTRLLFNQERGQVDYLKDKDFKTIEEAQEYIHTEFSKCIRQLHRIYNSPLNKKSKYKYVINHKTK